MPTRMPIVAGRFYPAEPDLLRQEVLAALAAAPSAPDGPHSDGPRTGRLLGLMLPHAGYIYSGRVAGATLACPWNDKGKDRWNDSTTGASLPQRLVLLCPNHTGQGHPLGVWPDGQWLTPLGSVPVDAAMANGLCATGIFAPDTLSHLGEHSIEVLLPFLQCLPQPPQGARIITPVCVGEHRPQVLHKAGLALAAAIKASQNSGQDVGIIVSSDMNHYESQQATIARDARVLQAALNCDPAALLSTVAAEHSSMCGVRGLALALFAAQELGSPRAELVTYDTSATASGDTSHVVGYAGLILKLA